MNNICAECVHFVAVGNGWRKCDCHKSPSYLKVVFDFHLACKEFKKRNKKEG